MRCKDIRIPDSSSCQLLIDMHDYATAVLIRGEIERRRHRRGETLIAREQRITPVIPEATEHLPGVPALYEAL